MDYTRFAPELLITEDGPVRIITMNRPDELNSFDDALHTSMRRVWDALVDDEDASAVVLTGAGRAFSSGGYVQNFARNYHNLTTRRRDCREAERLAKAMIDCELPIVAAVNGPAVGLGCSLAVMSDLVVMADDTYFADTHVNVGLVAGDGGVVTWPLMMSLLKVKEYLLLCDRMPAAEAAQLGLANRVVPREDVMPVAVLQLANRLAAQPAQALRDTKRALNMHLSSAVLLNLSFGLSAEAESFSTEDVKQKVEEFTNRSR